MVEEKQVALDGDERKKRLGHGGIRDIARLAGVHESHVSRVVRGLERNERVEAMVTGRIGKRGEVVFPPRGEK